LHYCKKERECKKVTLIAMPLEIDTPIRGGVNGCLRGWQARPASANRKNLMVTKTKCKPTRISPKLGPKTVRVLAHKRSKPKGNSMASASECVNASHLLKRHAYPYQKLRLIFSMRFIS